MSSVLFKSWPDPEQTNHLDVSRCKGQGKQYKAYTRYNLFMALKKRYESSAILKHTLAR